MSEFSGLHVYGLSNCDTVKKARTLLDQAGAIYQFHDFKRQAPDLNLLKLWAAQLGSDALLNKRGTTWRGLSRDEQDSSTTEVDLFLLLQRLPALIKRPVTHWPNGVWTLGFNSSAWSSLLNAPKL